MHFLRWDTQKGGNNGGSNSSPVYDNFPLHNLGIQFGDNTQLFFGEGVGAESPTLSINGIGHFGGLNFIIIPFNSISTLVILKCRSCFFRFSWSKTQPRASFA